MSNHRKRPANKLEIEDEPEVKNTLDKRINDQPPTKLQKVVQNDQTSMKGSEDSKDQTIETQLPKDKKHVSCPVCFKKFLKIENMHLHVNVHKNNETVEKMKAAWKEKNKAAVCAESSQFIKDAIEKLKVLRCKKMQVKFK